MRREGLRLIPQSFRRGLCFALDLHQCLRISDRRFYISRLSGFVMTRLASGPRHGVGALAFKHAPQGLGPHQLNSLHFNSY